MGHIHRIIVLSFFTAASLLLGACNAVEENPTEPDPPSIPPATPPSTPPGTSPTTYALGISLSGAGTVTDSAHGISCATSCNAQIDAGTTVTLAAQPAAGQAFDGWSGACSGTGGCSVTMQAATSVGAHFVAATAGTPSGQSLFAAATGPGTVTVTLHPGSQVVLGQSTRVAFGVPLPRGLVADVGMLRLTNPSGTEIPSAVRELTRWRTIPASSPGSVRSVLFYVDVIFDQRVPQTLVVNFGQARSVELPGTMPAVSTLWTSIANGPDPAEYPASDDIREPVVYATLPAGWLSQNLLVTRTNPVGENSSLAWWDSGLTNFGRTAVNDVASTVPASAYIDLVTSEPWLYDRALTLFTVYIRTGDVYWLRRAHRATQFYSKRVGTSGIFTLASSTSDLKYSYGMSPLIDYLFTGDETLRTTIDRVATAGVREWQTTYSTSMGFWTERHHSYALLAALAAYQATGNATHAQRATALADLTIQMSQNSSGCPLHTVEQHEGVANDTRMMCSPWMDAILAEAMLQYYILSEDERVLQWLSGMGDYVRNHAVYDGSLSGSDLAGRTLPWYLAGVGNHVEDGLGWGDLEHACDVAGLAAKAVWAKRRLGLAHASTEAVADQLLSSCQFVLDYWHRSTPTLAEYRLSPPRKFSWWFGSSSDLEWMLGR